MEEEHSLLVIPDDKSFLTLSKSEISDIVAEVAYNLNEGFIDHDKAIVVGKKLDELSKQYNETVRQLSKGKIKLQKGEVYLKNGVEITEAETGVSYDYSSCDDGEWNLLTEKIEPLIAMRKTRESFLKTIRKEYVNEDTGEVIQPPLRTGSTSYKLTFKK